MNDRLKNRPHPPARSQAFFEEFPHSPKPPQMPLQTLDDPDALKSLFVSDVPLARSLVRAAFLASGYTRFHKRLPERLDQVLESVNQIGGIGPTVAATMALVDAPSMRDPFVRAATMLKACWEIHSTIRAGQFPPDVHNGQALEMRQYLNLFGSSLVLDGGTFRLSKTGTLSDVLVLARGKSYVVHFDQHAESASVPLVADTLKAVWDRAAVEEFENPPGALGALSSVSLELQAEHLSAALEDPSNARSYEAVRNTFVTLCLDLDHAPNSYAEAALVAHSRNCANRWFHASLQLVIFANARACVICDFNAGLGGNTMVRAAAEIHRRSLAWAGPSPLDHVSGLAGIEEARWNLGQPFFDRAQADLNRVLDTQQATFEVTGHGRLSLASAGLEPVPTFAIAVQLAVYRLTGRFARIRQFVTQSKYRSQNVALAAVSTPEMEELVHALALPDQNAVRLRPLLQAAMESQRKQYRQARSTISVARALHLFRTVHKGMRRRYVELVVRRTFKLLRALELQELPPPTDIALSYPDTFLEVPVMGRPGIRLPYVNCFGLHYQIWDDRITLTLMPSTKWTIPNTELVAELEACLDLVSGLWSGKVSKARTGGTCANEMAPTSRPSDLPAGMMRGS